MAQLAQRLGLNLANALPRDVELLANLLERARLAIVQAIAQAQHLGLPRRERIEHVHKLLLEQRNGYGLRGRRRILVFDEVAQMAVVFLADRRLQRDRLLRNFDDLAHLFL